MFDEEAPEWTCGFCFKTGSLMEGLFHNCLPEDPDDGSAGVVSKIDPFDPSGPPAIERERELVGASS